MSLISIENTFLNYLKNNRAKDQDMLPFIASDEKFNTEARLKIYYEGYRLRLIEVLINDFPKLHTLVGDEVFESIALRYIDAYPSKHFSIRHFGQYLSSFLKNASLFAHQPYLAEMAEFEWALGLTQDAADDFVLGPEVLNSLPLENFAELKVHFHPSTQLLYFHWDIPDLWVAIDGHEPERTPIATLDTTWIVYRSGLEAAFRSMDPSEVLAFTVLREGKTFADLCEKLSETMEEEAIPSFLLGNLNQWLTDGIVSKIR